jgi:beta-1,4-mannosyltransferase
VLRVFARPGRNGINPFTGLIADAIERHGAQVHDVRLSRWNLPFSRSVLLLHWPDELYRNPKNLKVLIVAYMWLAHMTLAKLLAGLAVVWVAHNAVPHGDAPDEPPLRWKWFLRLLDGVIVLSQESRKEVLAAHPSLAAKHWLVTTHGHYLDRAITPPKLPPPLADRPVRLGALGSVRANKRFVDLARAVSESGDEVELAITGDPESQALVDELAAIAATCPRIALRLGYLTDEAMEKATDAADLVVLPYAGIVNSGVLLYALSRYRPVVAPRMGSIPEVAQQIGADWVYLFDGPFGGQVLADAIRWLRETRRPAPPDLSAQDWDTIGKDVSEFLAGLLRGGRPVSP